MRINNDDDSLYIQCMKTKLHLLFNFITLLLLISCSSYKKKGDDFFKAGKYKDARDMYVIALQKDPKNAEAKEGKEKAEFQYANKVLVKMRDLRSAKKYEKAIIKAKHLDEMLEEWDTNLGPNMASFYSSEMRKLFPRYLAMIDAAIDKKKPFKANYLYMAYLPLFESYDFKKHLIKKPKRFNPMGKSFCMQHLSKGMEFPFWRNLIRKVCQHFKVANIDKIKETSIPGENLYKKIKIKKKFGWMRRNVRSLVLTSIKDSFENSSWKHKNGKRYVNARAGGSYSFQSEYYDVLRSKSYYDDKDKEKTFNYYVRRYDESISLKIDFSAKLGKQKIHNNFVEEKNHTTYQYDGHSDPDVDSITPDLIKENDWMDNNLKLLTTKLSLDFNKKYQDIFCKGVNNSSVLYDNGNRAILCLRAKNPVLDKKINKWYLKNFSITHQELEELIGSYYE